MIKRCNQCGRISLTGKYCLACDNGFWKFWWRRGGIQITIPSVLLGIVGIVILALVNLFLGLLLLLCGVLGHLVAFIYGTTIGEKRCFEDVKQKVI